MRRHLRENGANDQLILLHSAKTVGENLLADPLQILLKLVKSSRTNKKISYYQKFPFAVDKLNRGRYGTFGQFDFSLHTHSPLYVT